MLYCLVSCGFKKKKKKKNVPKKFKTKKTMTTNRTTDNSNSAGFVVNQNLSNDARITRNRANESGATPSREIAASAGIDNDIDGWGHKQHPETGSKPKRMSLREKMFRVKPIKHEVEVTGRRASTITEDEHDGDLPRVLGVIDLVSFGISTTVGSGIFVVAGIAGKFAGPSLYLSFVIGGFSSLLSGLAYVEFATRVPVSGSAYTYAYCAYVSMFFWTFFNFCVFTCKLNVYFLGKSERQ